MSLSSSGSRTSPAAQDAEAWARRLYARLPLTYRIEDLELARRRSTAGSDDDALLRAPLLGLLRTVARQVAELRGDIDALWDDFFLETCDDRVVPYLAALLGTELLDNPVGQDNRLDVLHTVRWRRSKGTPAMLAEVASATSGWPVEVVELLGTLAWVQHLDHVKAERTLTPRLDDPQSLAELGWAADRCAHLVDLRGASDLDLPRLDRGRAAGAPPGERGAWGTPGRYRIGTVGVVARPLQAFRVSGATPAPLGPRTCTFDPRRAPGPLFSARDRVPLRRVDEEHRLGELFGAGPEHDLAVRRWGVLLATPTTTGTDRRPAEADFGFGTPDPDAALHPTDGLRLLGHRPGAGSEHVVLTALWEAGGELRRLGALSTALWPQPRAYVRDQPLGAGGRLVVRVEAGAPDPTLGWGDLLPAGTVRLPATVLAVRDDQPPRAALGPDGMPAVDGAYAGAVLVHLPELVVAPAAPVDLLVGADGSTHHVTVGPDGGLRRHAVARAAQGPVWPPAGPEPPSPWPLTLPAGLHRRSGLRIADPTRLDPADGVLLELYALAGAPELLGGLPTADVAVNARLRSDYLIPAEVDTWPAFTFRPSADAALDRLPRDTGRALAFAVAPPDPTRPAVEPVVVPQLEVVVTDRAGRAVLTYLPQLELNEAEPVAWLLLADDGSTYHTLGSQLLEPVPVPLELAVSRAGAGQVLPLEGAVPLQRRVAVAGPPASGELGVHVESGRFCLAPDDPLLALQPGARDLTVDYVEAFPARLGARTYARPAPDVAATRVIASSGDAAVDLPAWRIHPTVSAALAAATDGDVIEIVDSATYAEDAVVPLDLAGAAHGITVRAARSVHVARPCLAPAAGTGEEAALVVRGPDGEGGTRAGHRLTLAGLLVTGQALLVSGHPAEVVLRACTLDPPPGGRPSLLVADDGPARRGRVAVHDTQVGGVQLGPGVADLVVTDSVVAAVQSAGRVELERVSVLGPLRCDALTASESLLAGRADVDDRQRGCIRFSRYEPGSLLPRRFRCVPADDGPDPGARLAFRSLRHTSPWFASVAPTAGSGVRTASEAGDVVGAFTSSHPGLRLANLQRRLADALPVGLQSVVVTRS